MTQTVRSLTGSSRRYIPFVVQNVDGNLFVLASTDEGITRTKATTLGKDSGYLFAEGLTVAQTAILDGHVHVQVKGPEGNRNYGNAFETNDPAVAALLNEDPE